MLTFFHFEKCTFESDILGQNIVCDSIIKQWCEYGCLLLPVTEKINISLYIGCYPEKTREKWRVGFSHYKIIETTAPAIDLVAVRNTRDLVASMKDIAAACLVHNVQSDLVEINLDELKEHYFEAVHINDINSSECFENSKDNARKCIEKNSDLTHVWNARFKSLAIISKKITIIDRYLYENMISDYESGQETSLYKLVNLLPNVKHKFSISIYSCGGLKSRDEHKKIMSYVEVKIKGNPLFKSKISILDLNSCIESYFMNNAHDRLLMFDDYACEIGVGMEIFKSSNVVRNTSFSVKHKSFSLFPTVYPILSSNRSWHEEVMF